MVADHWFQQVGKILEAMEVTSDAIKIKAFMKVATSSLSLQFSFPVFSVWFPRKIAEQEKK